MSLIGGAIASAIAGAAAKVGAKMVGKVVSGVLGERGGQLAEAVVTSVAEKLGVEPEAIPDAAEKDLGTAVWKTEAEMPEMIALWSKGLDGQFALLEAETKEGLLQSAWRWGWMYLLALIWSCYLLVFPVLAVFGVHVERVDLAVLLTLTTWFISLYMGGHTVKALGESAINAVKTWKDGK
ncbi:MAG: hypothetical protein M9955_13400 [Rhizobiaceae bacterium]|nr:hypothetical protein [Rhizobiaceae bacterium]